MTEQKQHAYKLDMVRSEIYCSSSGHHWMMIHFSHNNKSQTGEWFFENESLDVYSKRYAMPPLQIKFPAYFIAEVKATILAKLPTARVFEYDRDMNKRYTDLRYHPDDWIEVQIAGWDKP